MRLDELLEAYHHRDHNGWLAQNIAHHRTMLLIDAGRYAEAEQAGKAWAELGFDWTFGRVCHGAAMAETLDALGRTREGLAVLEDALSAPDPKRVGIAWLYLEDLVGLSEKLGQPVDPKWRGLAEESAAANGVEMPQHESLGKAILELGKAIQKKLGVGDDDEDEDDDIEPKEPTSVE